MAARAESCAQCGKHGAGFKHCSRCKQASYCGAACQNADWKRHKTRCAPPVPLQDVVEKMSEANIQGYLAQKKTCAPTTLRLQGYLTHEKAPAPTILQ